MFDDPAVACPVRGCNKHISGLTCARYRSSGQPKVLQDPARPKEAPEPRGRMSIQQYQHNIPEGGQTQRYQHAGTNQNMHRRTLFFAW
jgi:hypothetical protein